MSKPIHFIGLDEPILCDLAIALQQQGYAVTGSAEAVSESMASTLTQARLLPKELGWFPHKLTKNMGQVIIGRQVQAANSELQAALQLGLKVYSYPQYIYEYAQHKQRVVITGGLETLYVGAIAMHVLRYWHDAFDYILDKPMPGWNTMARLSEAPIILLQADGLPGSCLDPMPQFSTYQHNILLISGISEERGHRYATINEYLAQLQALAAASPKGGTLIYHGEIELLQSIGSKPRPDVKTYAYQALSYWYQGDQAYLSTPQGKIPVLAADPISLHAIPGAQLLLGQLGITQEQFYEAIPSFSMD